MMRKSMFKIDPDHPNRLPLALKWAVYVCVFTVIFVSLIACETVPVARVDVRKVEALSKVSQGVKSLKLNKAATELACGKGKHGCIMQTQAGNVIIYTTDWRLI